ncbi:MAG TPA: adenylate/guanylate cyclase domain-containing protein [Terriglobales bacterium]|nr:adenylate/guanylate cyclase domain-containing protein [Terriglobales bacterium]
MIRRSKLRRTVTQFALRHADAAIAVLVTSIGLVLFAFAGIGGNQRAGFVFLQNIEQRTLDLRFAIRGARAPDPRIAIVGIDDKTLQNLGAFPLPRNSYATLVDKLKHDGARVIAFDATFPTPEHDPAGEVLRKLSQELGQTASPSTLARIHTLEQEKDPDQQFAASLKAAGNVVLGHIFLNAATAKTADPKIAEAYFNIIWAKAFPQVLKVQSKKQNFDLAKAWIESGGSVASGVEANMAELAQAAASYGYLNISSDPDGTLRHAILMIRYQDQDFFPPLAMEVLREYEQIPDQQMAAYISENGLERIQLGRHELHPAHDGSALINYAGPYLTYPHYSMWDVITGATPAGTFRDKMVFIGGTALGIGELRNTPFEKQDSGYMGVEVHANILDNLLHSGEQGRSFLIRGFREELIDVGFILFFGLGVALWFGRSRPLVSTISVVILLAAFGWFSYYSFAEWGRWIAFVIPAGTLVVNYATISSYRVIFEEREKRRIRKTFSQYLSPGVIALIEEDPQKYIRPGGEVKELTVMFSDIRDFTSLSEGLTPDELVELLNQYLSAMTNVLFKNLGTLDKYIGDAIMAFWGSPYPQADHALRACACAVEMQSTLTGLNQKWVADGHRPIAFGIGLNTGLVNVGNMGSDKRLSWTVMGDNVNLASRLEGMTKQYRTQVIISENTYREVKDHYVCREVDKIRVKGKSQPVTIYELMGPMSELPRHQALLTKFNQALAAYRTQDWRSAAGTLGELLAEFPDDGPTQILLQRSIEFMEAAPEPDWDGVYVMKSK